MAQYQDEFRILSGRIGGLKKTKVKNSTDALSYPRPLVKRSSEHFLFSL